MLLRSAKFDGSLHYQYPVELVQESADCLVAYSHPGVPVESYRGSWSAKKNLLSFYWVRRSYVAHVVWGEKWQPERLYIDISTATQWDVTTVRYVDLDLDVILAHGSTEVIIDDEDEFEINRLKWNYPADLVANSESRP